MSKVLLIGHNPPPLIGASKIEAANYRTWQFLEPLLETEHDVCLCAHQLTDHEVTTQDIPDRWSKKLTYHSLPLQKKIGWIGKLQDVHDTFDPDCIVAVNFDCCLSTTKLRTDRPIWMDIYGDYLTIMQVSRYRAGTDRGITNSIAFMNQVLRKGDKYSVCGTPQQHALVGELAMAGRLNSRSFSYDFVCPIFPAAALNNERSYGHVNGRLLERHGVPEGAFVVLWSGGYNAWTDIETLYAGLESAMEQNGRIHYVSVGASTYGETNNVYDRFLDMIEQSRYRAHYHMLGWRPWQEIEQYYLESDVGVNIDALHYETIYGTRTRLVEMIGARLPIITSLGCELSYLLHERGAASTFEVGDWRSLNQLIVVLATNPELLQRIERKAYSYARSNLSFKATTKALLDWVEQPRIAPDREKMDSLVKFRALEYTMRATLRQVLWRIAGLER